MSTDTIMYNMMEHDVLRHLFIDSEAWKNTFEG